MTVINSQTASYVYHINILKSFTFKIQTKVEKTETINLVDEIKDLQLNGYKKEDALLSRDKDKLIVNFKDSNYTIIFKDYYEQNSKGQ